MANSYFQFKQFTVWQEQTAMKVGTDGVLLGAWAGTKGVARALDVGTGTGLIALMLAQRSDARIEAVDVEAGAVAQANANFRASPWHERLNAWNVRIQEWEVSQPYDLLISNPPFFQHSLQTKNANKAMARHQVDMNFDDLISAANRLLRDDGKLALILPFDRAAGFRSKALLGGFHVFREMMLYPREGKPPHRCMLELGKKKMPVESRHLTIRNRSNNYTKAYKELTQDFYLHH